MIGDGEGVAVLAVAQSELPLEVDAPEVVGGGTGRKRGSLGATARATLVLDEAVAVEHGVDGAGGGRLDVVGQPADQEFA